MTEFYLEVKNNLGMGVDGRRRTSMTECQKYSNMLKRIIPLSCLMTF